MIGISSTIKTVVIGIVVAALLGGIGYFIYDYNQQTKLASEAGQWKGNFEQAESVNKENQQVVKQLEKDGIKFEGVLVKREQKLEAIHQELQDKEDATAKLGRENEQIRADLEYVISCGLWREIFPSTVCIDQDKSGETKNSTKPSATVPSSPGAPQ